MKQNPKKSEEDYHGIAPISKVIKKMKKQYDKDPKDWKIISSKDKDSNTDTLITKQPNTYWLKSKKLSPYSALSMGTVLKNIDNEIDNNINGQEIPLDNLKQNRLVFVKDFVQVINGQLTISGSPDLPIINLKISGAAVDQLDEPPVVLELNLVKQHYRNSKGKHKNFDWYRSKWNK